MRPVYFLGLLMCAYWLESQTLPSAVRLNPGQTVTNAIIYQNQGHQPLSDGVLGHHSALDVAFPETGTGNIQLTSDPFADRFRIHVGSPAFNSGTPDGARDWDTLDLDNNPRISCGAPDMGAFEYFDAPTAITQQPQPVHTVQGALPVVLAVAAEGANLRYQWLREGVELPGQTDNTLELGGSWADTGGYQVMVWGDCDGDVSPEVRVVYDFRELSSGGECPEEESWAKVWVDGTGYEFLWNTGSNDSIIKGFETGHYEVSISDGEGRSVVLDALFESYTPIEIEHTLKSPDNEHCDNGTIHITPTDPTYTYDFQWYYNSEFYSSGKDLTQASVGFYHLEIERQAHRFCPSDTFSFALLCRYKHAMPTTLISPNGDENNPYLDIKNIEYYPNNTVTVINAYGETIFRAKNYNNADVVWDGRNRAGRVVPDGVYYYLVEAAGVDSMSGCVVVKK